MVRYRKALFMNCFQFKIRIILCLFQISHLVIEGGPEVCAIPHLSIPWCSLECTIRVF